MWPNITTTKEARCSTLSQATSIANTLAMSPYLPVLGPDFFIQRFGWVMCCLFSLSVRGRCSTMIPVLCWGRPTCLHLVFKGPVSRLEKDRNWTGPAVQSFHFWDLKTAKRPVFMDRSHWLRHVFYSPIFTLQNAPKNIIFGPKLKKIWLKL